MTGAVLPTPEEDAAHCLAQAMAQGLEHCPIAACTLDGGMPILDRDRLSRVEALFPSGRAGGIANRHI